MTRKNCRKSLVVGLLALSSVAGLAPSGLAETRRALLVGISTYALSGPNGNPAQSGGCRDNYPNLDGCLNDVEAMQQVLISSRFGFEPNNVRMLTNSSATREHILAQIREQFIERAAKGDCCFFYFAGHGSLIRNLKSNKPSGMDSTIVPADSYLGAMDIRDKEIARLFNQALDKGVILTAVFDSCHSGSIARGVPKAQKSRVLRPCTIVVSDAPDPGKPPEQRGALIISAAQDYQSAYEDPVKPYGQFTLAFLKALQNSRENAPAEEVFLSTELFLGAQNAEQVPVLAGTPERKQMPLLGMGKGKRAGQVVVGASSLDMLTHQITLDAGQAVGLNAGCELRRLPPPGENTNLPPIRLRVVQARGLASSLAEVVSGTFKQIGPGDLFEVDRWVYPSEATLRVWLPSGELSFADLRKLGPEIDALRTSERIQWVGDPTDETPGRFLTRERSGWGLQGGPSLGKELESGKVIQQACAGSESKPKLFLSLPPATELVRQLKLGEGTPNDSIELVSDPSKADYLLVGRWQDQKIQYAWVRPNSIKEDAQRAPLPVRTDWYELSGVGSVGELASTLEEKAVSIGRIRAWLTLSSSSGSGRFPYRLALKNTETGALKRFGDKALEGESYGLELLADAGADLDQGAVERRWIYVVSIDSWGKTQLVFPPNAQGNVGNHLPYQPAQAGADYPAEITLGDPSHPKLFCISEPFGVDTYVLLTTREVIVEPDVFKGEGVRTRRGAREEESPLQALFANLGARSRGTTPTAPAVPNNWSIERITIQSLSKAP